MHKTIVGIFDSHDRAESAAHQVKEEGLRTDDISIVRLDEGENEGQDSVNDNISDGTMTGGAIGGVAGLLLGMGSIAIPGLGVVAAAGPIAGLLGGAITGGVVGGLVDLGIPEDMGERYEGDIMQGRTLWSMPITDETGGKVSQILKNHGAISVELHKR